MKSLSTIFFLHTKFPNKPADPNTNNKLQIFEPTTFPIEISLFPLKEAIALTASSGALVPNATTVSPIINVDTPNAFAKLELPSTKQSAPFTNTTKPTTNNKIFNAII